MRKCENGSQSLFLAVDGCTVRRLSSRGRCSSVWMNHLLHVCKAVLDICTYHVQLIGHIQHFFLPKSVYGISFTVYKNTCLYGGESYIQVCLLVWLMYEIKMNKLEKTWETPEYTSQFRHNANSVLYTENASFSIDLFCLFHWFSFCLPVELDKQHTSYCVLEILLP